MQFENRYVASGDVDDIISTLSKGPPGEFDFGILFLSCIDHDAVQEIAAGLRENIAISHLVVGTCSGVIASDLEIEDAPGGSLLLAKCPGVRVSPFYLDQTELKQMQGSADWHRFFDIFPNENPIFFLFPDPFLFDLQSCIRGLNIAYPGCPVAGGLASGAQQPQGNTLILNEDVYDQGLVGIALTGDIIADTVVSQGCRPVGETFVVTKADQNVIYEVGGRSFLEVLQEVVGQADAQDQKLFHQAILIGIAMDEGKDGYQRGDFLIRGLMRLDQKTGAGSIGDDIHPGQSIRFQVRDAGAAIEDLDRLLALQEERRPQQKPVGALVFSCTGRGAGLFSCKNHDIMAIQKHLGPVPASGFFCAGEIGQIGSRSFLHGFTNSMLLFYDKSST
ncbi:MAG: FIST N-terminal domain-containing protein [Nitrospirota bacterium]|nr:FIST N-terminal domain-containing protein [Nitrospirota bacterium]